MLPGLLQAANYNDQVFVVRYATLTALVIWVGGMLLSLAQALYPGRLPTFDLISVACGAIIVAGLFVMKFIGPPPQSFTLRAALALLMTALALYAGLYHQSTTAILAVNIAAGLILLAWYARE